MSVFLARSTSMETQQENPTMSFRFVPVLFAALTLTIGLLPVAGASAQGYIEINQAIVDAGGGFPYVISAPGSYQLTGNLTKTAADGSVPAIEITTSNVVLDLGGFTIAGPGICARNGSTGVVTCFDHVPGTGIQESGGNTNIRIRNGSVKGFFNGISATATGMIVEVLTVYDNAFVGVSAIGDTSRIENVTAIRNGTNGLVVQNNSAVQSCDASQNDDYGILANLASSVRFNNVMGNRLGGMSLNSQAVFSQNEVLDNFGPDPVFSGTDGGGNNCTNAAGTPVGC